MSKGGPEDLQGQIPPAFAQTPSDQDLKGGSGADGQHFEGQENEGGIAGAIDGRFVKAGEEKVVREDHHELDHGSGGNRQGDPEQAPNVNLEVAGGGVHRAKVRQIPGDSSLLGAKLHLHHVHS